MCLIPLVSNCLAPRMDPCLSRRPSSLIILLSRIVPNLLRLGRFRPSAFTSPYSSIFPLPRSSSPLPPSPSPCLSPCLFLLFPFPRHLLTPYFPSIPIEEHTPPSSPASELPPPPPLPLPPIPISRTPPRIAVPGSTLFETHSTPFSPPPPLRFGQPVSQCLPPPRPTSCLLFPTSSFLPLP
jgi:hypothetical protein